MDTFELFEEWCNMTIQLEEEKRDQAIILQAEPKWKIKQDFFKGKAYECYNALKVIDKFKKEVLNDKN
jgi:hypothetical protein